MTCQRSHGKFEGQAMNSGPPTRDSAPSIISMLLPMTTLTYVQPILLQVRAKVKSGSLTLLIEGITTCGIS